MSRRSMLVIVIAIALAVAGGVTFWLLRGGSSGATNYENVTEIVNAMNDHGLDCVNVVLQPVKGLQDFGSCHLADTPENEVDIYVYADHQRERDGFAGATAFHSMAVLEGSNWFMTTGTTAEANRIQDAIGGTVHRATVTPTTTPS